MVESAVAREEVEADERLCLSRALPAVEGGHGLPGQGDAIFPKELERVTLRGMRNAAHGKRGEVTEDLDVPLRGHHPAPFEDAAGTSC